MQRFLDECDYLIHLVRCTIHDLQPMELPDGMDFEYVYEWGVFHHIANIAFYSVEKLIQKPEEALYLKWQTCRDQAIIRDITQNFVAQEIRQFFTTDFAAEFIIEALLSWTSEGKAFDEIYSMVGRLL